MTRNGFVTECDRGAITLDVFPKDGTKVFFTGVVVSPDV